MIKIDPIQKRLLAEIADLHAVPEGAYNIRANGEDITDMSITDRSKKGIGFAFQQPVKFKGIRVLDLIRLAAGRELSVTDRARMGIAFAFQQPVRFKGLRVLDLLRIAAGRRLDISAACEYLAAVGLCAKDYIDREVNASLSGGELKRIEIATVLARKARLTIFDEPEAGIDLWSFQNLIQVFERLRRDIRDSSIMIISHPERILAAADRIIVIQEGEVLRQGSRDEILPTLIGTAAAVRACRQAEQGGAQ